MGRKAKLKKVFRLFAIILIGFLAVLIAFDLGGLRFNFTNSMPIGLYHLNKNAPIDRGDFVFVCLPDQIAEEGFDRNYLSYGICPHHISPVLKEVIALPQDQVRLTEQAIIVSGHSFSAPLQKLDRNSLPLDHIKRGNYANNQYWLYGASDPIHSWDSRYYGSVDAINILGTATPIFVFSNSQSPSP